MLWIQNAWWTCRRFRALNRHAEWSTKYSIFLNQGLAEDARSGDLYVPGNRVWRKEIDRTFYSLSVKHCVQRWTEETKVLKYQNTSVKRSYLWTTCTTTEDWHGPQRKWRSQTYGWGRLVGFWNWTVRKADEFWMPNLTGIFLIAGSSQRWEYYHNRLGVATPGRNPWCLIIATERKGSALWACLGSHEVLYYNPATK